MTSPTKSAYSICRCITSGRPRVCIKKRPAPLVATTSAILASNVSPLISFTKLAPATIASCATCDLVVSIEIGTSLFCRSALITGITRSSSSFNVIPLAPGRVLSPPISMITAPDLIISRPRSTATPTSCHLLPAKKESGVTFKIPIIAGLLKSS